MVGGHSALSKDERLLRFVFPERPGALMKFLSSMQPGWNISLFHYRNQGADYGRILVGLQVGVVFGTVVPLLPTALPFGSVPQQLVGAAVVSAAAALTNGGRLKTIFVSGILGGVTMIGFAVATALGLDMATASGVGALASSCAGGVAAKRLHLPAIAVTTAAIIPLVPGVAIFRGLLGIVQAEGAFDGLVIGGNALVLAAITAVALAAGVSFGLYMATPVRDTLRRVTRSRVGLHH